MNNVVIAGAGISGLAVAHFLNRIAPHVDVTIIDSASRVGGCVATYAESGFIVEAGPNGFLDGKPNTIMLARDLGLGKWLIAASEGSRKNRFLYLNQKI